MQSVLILGRQPAIGLAELESLYGETKLKQLNDQAVMVEVDPLLLAFDRLGGSVMFCKHLDTLDTASWADIEQYLLKVGPEQSKTMTAGKMKLGLSLCGFELPLKDIAATGFKLKKTIQKTGRSVRVIPNKALALNSAQIIHNKLTGPNGWSLVFIRSNNQTIIAQTVKAQDIEAYTKRDYVRPKRDLRVGMLPPKLAQIMINLAVGLLPEESRRSVCDYPSEAVILPPHFDQTVLDPFCGGGTILQEALLMGYDVFGTDLDPRMVEYAKANVMDWLKQQNHPQLKAELTINQADAASFVWPKASFNFIASETALGKPYSSPPSPGDLAKTLSDCSQLIKQFLKNLASQTEPGTRLCLAVPAWQIKPNQFKYLPLIDQISELGYNQVRFKHISDEDLLYFRSHQIVARKLLVLIRK